MESTQVTIVANKVPQFNCRGLLRCFTRQKKTWKTACSAAPRSTAVQRSWKFQPGKKMKKRVVMVTAVTEDGCARYHHMGEVDEDEFEQLRQLQGSTVHDRQRRFLEFSVLARVYTYEKDGGKYYEDFLTKETFSFARVKPEDVCNYLCYHIIWEAGG